MIKVYKKIVDETLEQYFKEILKNETHFRAKKSIEAMKYTACLCGKRLRAILALEACNIFSKDYFAVIPSACALEMLHAQSLIHDDLPAMDNDNLRRGKPSNHKVFGEAIAILAGDALISLGAQIIIKKTPKSICPEKVLAVVNEYLNAAGIFGIVGGQTADIEAQNLILDEDYLQYIQNYKTGVLFEASLAIGGIIGGADLSKIAVLKQFGKAFGKAFQMADDILDVISTTDVLGKTAGKDKVENKLTYVKKYGLEGAKQKLTEQIKEARAIVKANDIKSCIFDKIIESVTGKII